MPQLAKDLKEIGLKLNGGLKVPELGIVYGSKERGRDIDLFFIFKTPVKKNIIHNQFDLSQIEYNDFQFRLGNFDIEYTEPILTGDYIFGNFEIIEKAREFLNVHKPTEKNLDYMGKRALETYLQAEVLYSQGKSELFDNIANGEGDFNDLTSKILCGENFVFNSPIILKSLSLLTYSLSYLASRRRYTLEEKEITLKGILDNPETEYDRELVRLIKYFKSSSEKRKMKILPVDQYFGSTKDLLKRETIQ